MEPNNSQCQKTEGEGVYIGAAQLLLAEKRTSLAMMRTGIAMFALPLSVVSFLIVFSKHYDFTDQLSLLVPVFTACLCLGCLGAFLTFRSVKKVLHYDRVMTDLKRGHPLLAKYMD